MKKFTNFTNRLTTVDTNQLIIYKMARTKKYTPEETESLFNLQFIDSKIDSMREVREELYGS